MATPTRRATKPPPEPEVGAFLRAFFEQSARPLVLVGRHAILAANSAAAGALGYETPRALEGRRPEALLGIGGLHHIRRDPDPTRRRRLALDNADGETVEVLATVTPAAAPGAPAWMVSWQEIPTEVSAQLVESLPALWFRFDRDGRVLDFHAPPGVAALAVSDHVAGARILDTWPADLAEGTLLRVRAAIATGEPQVHDQELVLDGATRWFHCRIVPSGVDEATAVFTDITERKATEHSLTVARDHAIALAAERARFVATMSHEVRTPINGILGMTELLLDSELNDEQRSYLDMLQRAGRTLLSAVNNVLDYSRIEAGHLDLDEVAFSPRELAENVVAIVCEQAHARGVELTAVIDNDVPRSVVGDPTRLGQVLTNLVGNAVKFTLEGEVIVRVTCRGSAIGRPQLIVHVIDTGIGIDEAGLSRIFEPFVQADGSTTRRFGGAGLGLAISRRVTEAMGGRVWAESEVGRGSVFTLAVPVGVPEGITRRVAAVSASHAPQLRGRALLVAASQGLGAQLRNELLQLRQDVVVAADLASARAALATPGEPWTMVLVGVNGATPAELEAYRRLAEERGLPTAVLAPFGVRSLAQKARSAGFAHVVTRPTRQATIVQLVEELQLSQVASAAS
ncbi:MAG: PAS domain-containing protein [Myxococcales bacterium]|nr:PAS domain-containing protein [Myxococcales bacterium]MCB9735549.1 PAS domain-containing protein [Deltaproteobacteria bacterium]